MAMNQIFIIIGGILSLLIFVFHLSFPILFQWGAILKRVKEPINRIFYTIHIALYALFLGITYISLRYSSELATAEGLAQGVLLVMALFWLWRTIWQLVYFKAMKGKPQIQIILTTWFALLCICYTWPLIF